MANYQIAYNRGNKNAVIQALGDAIPADVGGISYFKIGEFTHENVEPALRDLEFDVNHVFFQHVRDALYHTNAATGQAVPGSLQFPNNITDMAGVIITLDEAYVAVVSVSSTPATVSLANGATQQITNVFTPGSPSNTGVTYTTSNAAIATVSPTGLITAGATDGEATITVHTVDGDKTDTVVVTVA